MKLHLMEFRNTHKTLIEFIILLFIKSNSVRRWKFTKVLVRKAGNGYLGNHWLMISAYCCTFQAKIGKIFCIQQKL